VRWFVKLLSCAMQQKLFGENLSGSVGRGLHSTTFQLNISAFCGIGGVFMGCHWGVKEVSWGDRRCVGCMVCQEGLKLSSKVDECKPLSVGVRYAVGVNSVQMRAIRYCLMQPGFTAPKIAILCGGPDWQGCSFTTTTNPDRCTTYLQMLLQYRRWMLSST